MQPLIDVEKLIIDKKVSIKSALKAMDHGGKRILLIVEEGKLRGVVTDGDFRRWILNNGDLNATVDSIANFKPIVIKLSDYNAKATKELMTRHHIESVPVVDDTGALKGVAYWYDLEKGSRLIAQRISAPVVIMAGGTGSRLHPYTKILPKPLIPIGEEPIIERIMERFRRYSCNNFYVSVNFKSAMIKAYFAENKHEDRISFLEEIEPLGTAGALRYLENQISQPFFVTNCDILVEADYAQILKMHTESKNAITIVGSLKQFTVPYGIVEIGSKQEVTSIREKPEFNFLVNTGFYVLEPQIFSLLPSEGRFDMTDLINLGMKQNLRVGVFPVSEGSWLDMGQFEELANMQKRLSQADH